jgi:endoglucanase
MRPVALSLPRISGAPRVGHVLRASPGRWRGARRFTFRWQVCNPGGAQCRTLTRASRRTVSCVRRKSSSGSRLCRRVARSPVRTDPLTSREVGHTIRVTVLARNKAGAASATSRSTAVVEAPIAPPDRSPGLHVSGDRLLDSGHIVHLHGVNRAGTEYSCVQGWGIFDGPSDDASVAAIASWHSNIVRVPLNEDCWLGINGVNPAFSGQSYIDAIVNYVGLLHAHGMYAELSLIWGAPGAYPALYQPAAPDADHAPAFWASLAATFKDVPNVILAPWGETVTGWRCFMQTGCSDQATYGPANQGYQTASMQQAVNVMRGAGYRGPIAIPCISYANMCGTLPDGSNYNGSTWLRSHPNDPLHQLIAEAHVYGKNNCATTACFSSSMLPILRGGFPVLWGEVGESYDGLDCGSANISTFLSWADQKGIGYEAWTWNTWGTCGSLISDYAGTPANAYGAWVMSHYVALR